VPPELAGHELEGAYRENAASLVAAYQDVHAQGVAWLRERHPRPDSMDAKAYERNVAARAFDMARSLLPLGIPTSLGQVTSIRTLERQISRLMVSELAEVRDFAQRLVEGCRTPVADGGKAPAPTLARHARPFEWQRETRRRAKEHARELCGEPQPPRAAGTTLHRAPDPPIEMLASLLHEDSGWPWEALVGRVASLSAGERRRRIEDVLRERGSFDELPRACRAGTRYVFEIVMDVGGWRDMHRHRRCVQLWQPLDPASGGELPPDAEAADIASRVQAEHERACALARRIAASVSPRAAQYALPLMHRIRCVFKMDFAEADYIARLRSGVKGHPSYRKVAWDMCEALRAAEPELAALLAATPPSVEDPLTR
jgi:thymidylate synthase ThyX